MKEIVPMFQNGVPTWRLSFIIPFLFVLSVLCIYGVYIISEEGVLSASTTEHYVSPSNIPSSVSTK